MGPPPRRRRRPPSQGEQAAHLAGRFGLHLREDFGPLAERSRAPQSLWNAVDVPYYALLHHGNVVPREALAQRGRMAGSIAVDVGVRGLSAPRATDRARLLARILMAQYEAPGAVYDVRPLRWRATSGSGELAIEVATGRGEGDRVVTVEDGDLTPVLETLATSVRPASTALVLTRDPVDLRDEPASTWRWIHPVSPPDRVEEFQRLHREMAFEVLTALVHAPEGSCRPLKSVPPGYLDVPGLEPRDLR